MNNPVLKFILILLGIGVVGWLFVGLIAFIVKWSWWVEEGSWLQYLPAIIPLAIVILLCLISLVISIANYAKSHKKDETTH